jgi:hypothetical protein
LMRFSGLRFYPNRGFRRLQGQFCFSFPFLLYVEIVSKSASKALTD